MELLKRNLIILLLYSFTLFLSSPLLSQAVDYNEVFQVSMSASDIHGIEVIELTNGNIVYCWTNQSDSYKIGINAQVFDSNLVKIGNEISVTNHDYATDLSVSALSSGGFIIAWSNIFLNSGSDELVYQLFDNNAIKIGEEKKVFDSEFGQREPQIVELYNNQILISWIQSGNLMGRKFNSEGVSLGDMSLLIKKDTRYELDKYTLLKLENNDLIIGYMETQDYSTPLKVKYFTKEGISKGNPIKIGDLNFEYHGIFSITGMNNGNVLCNWVEENGEYPNLEYKLFASVLDNSGNALIERKVIKNYMSSELWDMIILPINMSQYNDDGFFITWLEGPSYNSNSEQTIKAQIISSDLNKQFPEFIVQDKCSIPISVAKLDNTIFVAWRQGDHLFSKYYFDKAIVHDLYDFKLIEPEIDSIIDHFPITLNWETANKEKLCYPFEMEYNLYISTDEEFTSPSITKTGNDTSYQVHSLALRQTYFWKVLARNIAGDSLWSSNVNGFYIDPNATDVETTENTMLEKFELYQNYPNPFNPSTKIKYTIPQNTHPSIPSREGKERSDRGVLVTLKVYDVLGKAVATLVNKEQAVGNYEVEFDGNTLSSGVYFYKIQVDEFVDTKKMILMR